jgi:signal transduction histidine kinase
LTGIRLLLETAALAPTEASRDKLREARDLINELMARVSNLSLNLRPPMLDDLGLLPTLQWHIQRYTSQTNIRVKLESRGVQRGLTPQIKTAAYRIVQEALTNVARHAHVQEASVQLLFSRDRLRIKVKDRGIGFNTKRTLRAGHSGGIIGMRERVMSLGGNMTVNSALGRGTTLVAEVPLGDRGRDSGGQA